MNRSFRSWVLLCALGASAPVRGPHCVLAMGELPAELHGPSPRLGPWWGRDDQARTLLPLQLTLLGCPVPGQPSQLQSQQESRGLQPPRQPAILPPGVHALLWSSRPESELPHVSPPSSVEVRTRDLRGSVGSEAAASPRPVGWFSQEEASCHIVWTSAARAKAMWREAQVSAPVTRRVSQPQASPQLIPQPSPSAAAQAAWRIQGSCS